MMRYRRILRVIDWTDVILAYARIHCGLDYYCAIPLPMRWMSFP
jgi:hypothetical protein